MTASSSPNNPSTSSIRREFRHDGKLVAVAQLVAAGQPTERWIITPERELGQPARAVYASEIRGDAGAHLASVVAGAVKAATDQRHRTLSTT